VEAGVAKLVVLSRIVRWWTEKNHEKLPSEKSVSRSRFEPGIPRTQVRSFADCAVTVFQMVKRELVLQEETE
jgi:hypothetical protein